MNKKSLRCSLIFFGLLMPQLAFAGLNRAILVLIRGSLPTLDQIGILNFVVKNPLRLTQEELSDSVLATVLHESPEHRLQYESLELFNYISMARETPDNIAHLEFMLQYLSQSDIEDAIHIATTDGMMTINLAGQAVWFDKRQFLEVILRKAPHLLCQQSRTFEANYLVTGVNLVFSEPQSVMLTTALSCAIHYRKPDLVKHILNHPVFLKHKAGNLEAHLEQLSLCLQSALQWFTDKPSDDTELIIQILKQEISNL